MSNQRDAKERVSSAALIVAPALDRSQYLPGWCSLAPSIC